MASAAYWFSRLIANTVSLIMLAFAGELHDPIWTLTLADDLDVLAVGDRMTVNTIIVLLYIWIFQVPISWKKIEGGVAHAGLVFFQDLQKFELGISTFRAAWLAGWIADKLDIARLRAQELTGRCLGASPSRRCRWISSDLSWDHFMYGYQLHVRTGTSRYQRCYDLFSCISATRA